MATNLPIHPTVRAFVPDFVANAEGFEIEADSVAVDIEPEDAWLAWRGKPGSWADRIAACL